MDTAIADEVMEYLDSLFPDESASWIMSDECKWGVYNILIERLNTRQEIIDAIIRR